MLGLGSSPYVCVHCGHMSSALYKEFGSSNLKLSNCEKCGQNVDEYVEADNAIVFIDAVLQKLKVYRHILYNCDIRSEWKLAIVLLFCDAYYRGVVRRQKNAVLHGDDEMVYLELEWTFYLMCILALIENIAFLIVMIIIIQQIDTNTQKPKLTLRRIISSLIISNYGKIFLVPALLWGPDMATFHEYLLPLFIFMCEVRVCRVLCYCSTSLAASAVLCATLARYLVSHLDKFVLASQEIT